MEIRKENANDVKNGSEEKGNKPAGVFARMKERFKRVAAVAATLAVVSAGAVACSEDSSKAPNIPDAAADADVETDGGDVDADSDMDADTDTDVDGDVDTDTDTDADTDTADAGPDADTDTDEADAGLDGGEPDSDTEEEVCELGNDVVSGWVNLEYNLDLDDANVTLEYVGEIPAEDGDGIILNVLCLDDALPPVAMGVVFMDAPDYYVDLGGKRFSVEIHQSNWFAAHLTATVSDPL